MPSRLYPIDPEAEELQAFCRALLRLPGLPGEEGAVAQAVAARMVALDYDQVEIDEYGNVIGQITGARDGPCLFFDSHMDVVPVTNPEAWRHDPFGAEIEDGRLWGRGAADTRGSLAAMLYAAGRLPRHALHGRCLVVASVCEELLTGAALGPLLDRFKPDVLVTGEPTNLRLGVAQKGRCSLLVTTRGRSAHTSRPELGDNAVYKMMDAITRLRALPYTPDPLLGVGVLELTEIISEPLPGTSFVPHGCKARLIGRIMPGETAESVLSRLRASLDGIPGVDLRLVELRQECYTGRSLVMEDFIPGWRNPPGDPWQERILSALAVAGLPAIPFGAPCGTNASAGAGARGISSFIYGPGSLDQAHTIDEWVQLSELYAAYHGYQSIALACCKTL